MLLGSLVLMLGALVGGFLLIRSLGGEDDRPVEDPLERARRWAATVEGYAFTSEVTIAGAGEPANVTIDGQVSGATDVPDLLAVVTSDEGVFTILRLDGRNWIRGGPDAPWVATQEEPRLTRGTGRRIADLLDAFHEDSVERTAAGWEATGSAPAAALLGLAGTGDVSVRLALDGAARLRSIAATSTLRAGPDGGEVRLDTITRFRDFDEAFEWPTPPPAAVEPEPAPSP
jgi:hypothetical protein